MLAPKASPDCFPVRIAQAGRHVDRGEWASGLVLLLRLRQCARRFGCPDGDACADAAELLLGDLRVLVRDQIGTEPPQP